LLDLGELQENVGVIEIAIETAGRIQGRLLEIEGRAGECDGGDHGASAGISQTIEGCSCQVDEPGEH
jgi:hypothetical protein